MVYVPACNMGHSPVAVYRLKDLLYSFGHQPGAVHILGVMLPLLQVYLRARTFLADL